MPISIESLTITGYASDGTVLFTATTLGPLTLEQFKKGQGANSDYALGLDAEAAARLSAALAADPNLRLGLEAMLSGVNGGPERFRWSADQNEPVPEPATMVLLGTGLAGIAGAVRRKRKAAAAAKAAADANVV